MKKLNTKKGKRPTPFQRVGIMKNGLYPDDYLVIKETPESLYIKHKDTGKIKMIRY